MFETLNGQRNFGYFSTAVFWVVRCDAVSKNFSAVWKYGCQVKGNCAKYLSNKMVQTFKRNFWLTCKLDFFFLSLYFFFFFPLSIVYLYFLSITLTYRSWTVWCKVVCLYGRALERLLCQCSGRVQRLTPVSGNWCQCSAESGLMGSSCLC